MDQNFERNNKYFILDATKQNIGVVQVCKKRWHCQNNITGKKTNTRCVNRNQWARQMNMWYKKLLRYLIWIRKAGITRGKERWNLQNPKGSEVTLRRSTSRISRTSFEILVLTEKLEVPQNWGKEAYGSFCEEKLSALF